MDDESNNYNLEADNPVDNVELFERIFTKPGLGKYFLEIQISNCSLIS
jgi:hypothetical protein